MLPTVSMRTQYVPFLHHTVTPPHKPTFSSPAFLLPHTQRQQPGGCITKFGALPGELLGCHPLCHHHGNQECHPCPLPSSGHHHRKSNIAAAASELRRMLNQLTLSFLPPSIASCNLYCFLFTTSSSSYFIFQGYMNCDKVKPG